MSDRVSASITIGGLVTPDQFAQLAGLIMAEGLATEWGGEDFAPDNRIPGEPLNLFAHEVPWGRFEALEQYCCDQGIAYRRWSGSCPGSFGAERIVFDGSNGPFNYDTNDDDEIMLSVATISQLGSMRAIHDYLKPAEIEIPPLVIASAVRAAG